ncbi:MAG: hypothetical protein H0X31_01005 [Nostocaceae cyanobacterium]|nr:hypothetical protein [Nostocaceae cyanobacterium]
MAAGDANFIEQERKNIDRTDYADREYSLQLPLNSVIDTNTIALSSVAQVAVGDVLVQTQYLTINQFNQLLGKLDLDPGVTQKNYRSTLKALPGANLRNALDALALKLDIDTNLAETNFFSSLTHGQDFPDFQTDYNILTNLLNLNSFADFNNYPVSTGTIILDNLIESHISNTSNVTLLYLTPLIQGPITLSKGIKSEIVWAPQTFGDPSIAKHVSEGTFIFEDTSFFGATVSYASDLSPSFEEIDFPELGIGDWSGFVWNNQSWGGGGTSAPLRTYVPRNKQYCRFLRPRFVHTVSREKFSLLGGSLTLRPLKSRAYRS